MNRETALKILGLKPDVGKGDIKKAYYTLALKHHPDKNLGSGQKGTKEKFQEVKAAYDFLVENKEEVTGLSEENLNVIDSVEDLKFYLFKALVEKDTAFLTKLFSQFKSGEGERFGDYINECFEGHYSPLFIALTAAGMDGDLSLLELILTNGANPNTKVYNYATSLHHIRILENSQIVELLFKYGADPNIPDSLGNTPLHKVCNDDENYRIVELLLKCGANYNIQGESGRLPLYEACSNGCCRVVKLLLKYGAGVQSEHINKALLSTLQSKECEKKEIVEQLLKYGADPNCEIQDRRLIEHVPHSSNNEVKKLFVQYGGVDRRYLRDQTASACCCLVIASATLYYIESSWRYASVACALVACFFVNNAIQAAFFAKTTEPSPELVKIEKVNPLEIGQLQQ